MSKLSSGKSMSLTIPRSVAVHNSVFHADEVMACALLIIFDLVDKDKIIRTRDQSQLDNCEYVCDVGGFYDPNKKLFDHHQSEYKGSLSSAGMMLHYLEEKGVINKDIFNLLYSDLICSIDRNDNGSENVQQEYTFSDVIANFNPVNYDANQKDYDFYFLQALDFTCEHLKRMLKRYEDILSYRPIVEECMKNYHDCLIFSKSVPWIENFFALGGEGHPAKFVIMPTSDGWKLRGIPPSYEKLMQVRMQLPLQWAGLIGDDLKKISKIPGAIFCHKGLFISIWETKEDAEKALAITLKLGEK